MHFVYPSENLAVIMHPGRLESLPTARALSAALAQAGTGLRRAGGPRLAGRSGNRPRSLLGGVTQTQSQASLGLHFRLVPPM